MTWRGGVITRNTPAIARARQSLATEKRIWYHLRGYGAYFANRGALVIRARMPATIRQAGTVHAPRASMYAVMKTCLVRSPLGSITSMARRNRSGLVGLIPAIPADPHFNYYAFLLPVICIYYGLIGIMLKILWNEYGRMRIPTFLAFCGFVVFIHYFSAQNLLGYYQLYP
jgi:hypothetical protein